MNQVRYPYIGNPFGFKLPEPKPVIHPIITKWADLSKDQKKDLRKIKKIIFSIIGECKISLFGSTIKGNWDDESDYDLVIHKEISKELLAQLKQQTYPRKIDLSISKKDFVSSPGNNILI
jgi:predicted nucleotidyltransferase